MSWADVYTDYAAWQKAGEPDGYVWGVNWSLAYPGLVAHKSSERAITWTRRVGHPMFEASLTTNQFALSVIFHSLRTTRIDDQTALISRVIIPLNRK